MSSHDWHRCLLLPLPPADGILKPMTSAPVPVRLGPQGRLVVPVDLRRELSLDEGSELTIRSDGRRLILEPRAEVLRRLRDRFQRPTDEGVRLADELLADRREEARRDGD